MSSPESLHETLNTFYGTCTCVATCTIMTVVYFILTVVPAPEVTITRVLSSLSLRCNVITVMGIGTLDILWMKDDTEILRDNDAVGGPINNATLMLYTSHYNITMPNDNIMYSCQAIINTNLMVNSSDNYTLHWTGESVMYIQD